MIPESLKMICKEKMAKGLLAPSQDGCVGKCDTQNLPQPHQNYN